MQEKGWRVWIRDRLVAPWWSKYIAVPVIAACPTIVVAIWAADDPNLIGLAAAGTAILTAIKSGLNDVAAATVKELTEVREDLTRLIGHVRYVVTAKSRRFHEALRSRSEWSDSGEAFATITQPDLQIKQIVRAIHGFYQAKVPATERISVSLMRWNAEQRWLEVQEYFPDSASPVAHPSSFKDSATAAGKAYHQRRLIVCEDVDKDQNYLKLSNKVGGSMFAYPVEDELGGEVPFVVNVVSNQKNRFKKQHADGITLVMEVFGDRLLLENRLSRIRAATGVAVERRVG